MEAMTADTTIEWQQPRSFGVDRGWCTLASRALLVVLPVVLALVGYYRAQLAREPLPRPQGDAAFYAYQLQRAAECHGQWWRIADDPRLGHPYPTEFAKHPGLYEGVDLMLLASLFGNAFSAAWTYHLAILAALAFNGWIAGGGTSEATPEFAGIVALADQFAGRRLGLVNPALYDLYRLHAPGIVDVTRGGNTVSFPVTGGLFTVPGYRAGRGYDLVTGLGTVDAAQLVPGLAWASRSGGPPGAPR